MALRAPTALFPDKSCSVPRRVFSLHASLSSDSFIDVLKFMGPFPAPSPRVQQLTAAWLHSSDRPSQTPKCRAEASPEHSISLCAACWSLLSLRIWTQEVCAVLGHLRGDCECLCDRNAGWKWQRTRSHSPVIHGSAPIQTQTPTGAQRPSCLKWQTYTQHWALIQHSSIKPFKKRPVTAARVPLYTSLWTEGNSSQS